MELFQEEEPGVRCVQRVRLRLVQNKPRALLHLLRCRVHEGEAGDEECEEKVLRVLEQML
jgi:hypothetical protein